MALRYKLEFVPGGTAVRLHGNIDEAAAMPLTEIRRAVVGTSVLFDCANVGLINSIGAATWVSSIQAYKDLALVFTGLPHSFSALCLMLPGFTLNGIVDSLAVRYICAGCAGGSGATKSMLITRAEAMQAGSFPPRPCPQCGQNMGPEEEDEDLLIVLRGGSQTK